MKLSKDPLWFKDAVIYELHVRAFCDSNGDGIGDFPGLTSKLDYLADLGVNAIWLLPFYPSPLKDDGYDIADYTDVNPTYGNLDDVRAFIEQAHKRGLRVITELVCNHTSDQHAWFQRARRAPPGSPERDFYVWREDNTGYEEARIIFKDFETSNWAWDPVARAYYWHRFYSHQPDLNFENPAVKKAITDVLDFWFGMGVDGLRLDAVPYLYEREGTNCENLAETHAFLRELRAHVDAKYEDRMLLAEANQWPEDAVAYFGKGDECHMAFHFPLMPRMFMALRMEDRFPIIDILDQTPVIPENAQWALFLRNHDELTLEMVTDEERDYMYRAYATDAQARINLGIRRRLAPLLNNNRRRVELMNALLFSLPGTPVLYYGDEIGMGDNIYLGDRNGVRTPMQWSSNKNAGFSNGNRQRLYLPPIVDPEYHYESLNVETQQANPQSLLWWTKRLIALRAKSRAFGRGSIEFLHPDNFKVLAFVRRWQDERILVVANLSRFAHCAQLDLSAYKGMVPVEMMGRTKFPPIGDAPYAIALGPHSFYWFSLDSGRAPRAETVTEATPTVVAPGALASILSPEGRPALEEVLPAYLARQRWFAGKSRTIKSAQVSEVLPLAPGRELAFVSVAYQEADPDGYVLPLAAVEEAKGVVPVARVTSADEKPLGIVHDAVDDEAGCAAIRDLIIEGRRVAGTRGELRGEATPAMKAILGDAPAASLAPALLSAEQSNSSVVFGGKLVMKLIRRVEEGACSELELLRLLNQQGFPHVPRLAGWLEYRPRYGGTPSTLAVVTDFVVNEGVAWRHALDGVGNFFERVLATPTPPPPVTLPLLDLAASEPPPVIAGLLASDLEQSALLGRRTAEMHVALGSIKDDPRFAPESYTTLYQRSLYQSMRNQAGHTFRLLRQRLPELAPDARKAAEEVLSGEAALLERFKRITERRISSVRIRCHGDYHLGQVLRTGRDFVIIDFEGEPARSLDERRIKRTPLMDVAGMLRSYHYAALTALRKRVLRPQDAPRLTLWAHLWYSWTAAAFLRAYLPVAGALIPAARDEQDVLLESHLLGKVLYEVAYELASRPDWVWIPLNGLLELTRPAGTKAP